MVGVAQLSKQQCLAVLNSIQKRGSLSRPSGRWCLVAQVMDNVESLDLCASNPATSVKKVAPVKQTVEHFAAIGYGSLSDPMRKHT